MQSPGLCDYDFSSFHTQSPAAEGKDERERTEDGWAPPTPEESRQAICPSRTRKPRRAMLAGLEAGLFMTQCCPSPHDWLCGPGVKDRGGQTVAQFHMENRRKPGPGDVIRLVPLGDFGSDLEADWLCELVRRFFGGIGVQMHDVMPNDKVLKRVKSRRTQGFGTQLLTGDIHDHLATLHGRVRGKNAFATMAFTLFDLYPKEEWNFVFGQARPKNGTGVFSFARYRGKDPQQFRMRCAKVLCHELGHLFGMSHCIWYECLMCGSNGDWESDRHPLHLCPVELAKLDAALGGSLDVTKREAELEDFWRESGFEEDAERCRRSREALEAELGKLEAKTPKAVDGSTGRPTLEMPHPKHAKEVLTKLQKCTSDEFQVKHGIKGASGNQLAKKKGELRKMFADFLESASADALHQYSEQMIVDSRTKY